MSQGQFNEVMDSLMKGMGTLFSSHTVVGEATRIDDTIILPLIDISFGLGAGAGSASKKDSGSGGFGAKMSPSAVLIIRNGQTKLVNIKNQDTMTRILDLVPDVVNRFTKGNTESDISDDEAVAFAFDDGHTATDNKEKEA